MTAALSDQEIEALISSCEPLDRGGRGSISFAIRQLRRQRDEARKALQFSIDIAAPREPTKEMISAIHNIHRPGWDISWYKVWTTMFDAWSIATRAALAKAPSDGR